MTTAALRPLVEDVLDQVQLSIRAGSALPIDKAALKALIDGFRPFVEKQLPGLDPDADRQAWAADRRQVYAAAHVVGVIATGLAQLHRQKEVSGEILMEAKELVKKHCVNHFGREGCYCENPC